MSRIQTKAEKEPLMRMQRPSSASSQTTAHVLNSCFGDLLLDCQPVDAERIENLKVTKVGADQFHCSYVAALQKASLTGRLYLRTHVTSPNTNTSPRSPYCVMRFIVGYTVRICAVTHYPYPSTRLP